MRLTPLIAITAHSGPYHFRKGEWTEIRPLDLGYLLNEGSSTVFVEDGDLGFYHVRYVGAEARTVRVQTLDGPLSISVQPDEDVPSSRSIAAQLLRLADFIYTPPRELLAVVGRILIVRPAGLGDVLMTLPVVSAVRAQHPHLTIEYSTYGQNVRVLRGNKDIDVVLESGEEYEQDKYDAVFDISRLVEAERDSDVIPRMDIFARRFGVPLDDTEMFYQVDAEDELAVEQWLGTHPAIVVQAQAAMARRTPSKGRMLEILAAMVEEGWTPLVVDDAVDPEWSIPGVVNVTGQLSLAMLFALIDGADATLTGDSGIMHAANALRKPVVALFGPIRYELRVMDRDLTCFPIQGNEWRLCPSCNECKNIECHYPGKCLDAIPIDVIVSYLKRALNGSH